MASWFGGGSVYLAIVQGDWQTHAPSAASFEDGPVRCLQIPELEFGLSSVNDIGMDRIRQRVMCLTGWLVDRLAAARNGEPMERLYGPANTRDRGGASRSTCLTPAGG